MCHLTKRYAILSHTWGEGEVSFQDFKTPELAREKNGVAKIEETARLARSGNLDHVWVGTCCIDKFSSAELTEAINSMYQWYRDAKIWFVYLSDFDSGSSLPKDGPASPRWFSRG